MVSHTEVFYAVYKSESFLTVRNGDLSLYTEL